MISGIAFAGARRWVIYTIRGMMGLPYAGGQDDVLREVDSIFYLYVVGLGLIIVMLMLRRGARSDG